MIGDVLSATFPTWNVALLFSYPLGRSTAEASYARSRLEGNQGRLQIKNLELAIATEIRDAGRCGRTHRFGRLALGHGDQGDRAGVAPRARGRLTYPRSDVVHMKRWILRTN